MEAENQKLFGSSCEDLQNTPKQSTWLDLTWIVPWIAEVLIYRVLSSVVDCFIFRRMQSNKQTTKVRTQLVLLFILLACKCRLFYGCVVCLVSWPRNASEAAGGLALIETSLLFSCTCTLVSIRETLVTRVKQWGLYQNKITPASMPFKG